MNLIKYDQPTNLPVPKVAAAGAAGVIVTAVVTVLAMNGVIVPDSVSDAAVGAVSAMVFLASAAQTVITYLAAYLKRDQKPAAAVDAILGAKKVNEA